jgi:UDP-3-O-[3-hydroxymyristoyl] glucosamine N-acyltransferase
MPTFTLQEVAQHLKATAWSEVQISLQGITPPEKAGPKDLAFLLESTWTETIAHSRAGVVVIPATAPPHLRARPYLEVPHVRAAFAQALKLFYPRPRATAFIHPTAVIESDVTLGENVWIGPLSYLGRGASIGSESRIEAQVYIGQGVSIGTACLIYPQVVLREGVTLGNRVTLHSGTVLGSDGYGYYPHAGQHHKVPQVGGVEIGDDVEIGANVTIDRGTLDVTRIGKGTKIDNLVQIGHNVQIGEHSLLVAQVGISGSTHIGNRVTLAGQTGVAGHLQIGDDVIAAGKSGITKNIPAGLKVSGFPAQDHREELRLQAALRRVPELIKRWRQR